MTTDILARNTGKARLKDIQRGVLEAYARGLLSEKQAISQLGLRSYQELESLLKTEGLEAWEVNNQKKSVSDGYINYWLNNNPKD